MQEESGPGMGLDNQELTSEEALQLAEVLKKSWTSNKFLLVIRSHCDKWCLA